MNANTINFEVEIAALNSKEQRRPSKSVLYRLKEKNIPIQGKEI